MNTRQDELLRRCLVQLVADVRPPEVTPLGALRSGKAALRRRRVALATAAFMFVSVAVVGSAFAHVWFADTPALDAVPGRDRTTPAVSPSAAEDMWGWAGRLPMGKQTSLPFEADNVLHVAEERYPLPGTGAGVVGATVAGWLVLIEYDDTDAGGEFTSRYAVVARSGRIQELPQSRYQVQEAGISPDGELVAYGSTVVDVVTGRVVATIPASATDLTAWSSKGIVFSDSNGDSFLWRLGEDPIPLATPVDVVSMSGMAIERRSDGGCARVVDLRRDGSLRPVWRGCGADVPSLVAPRGDVAVTVGLSVVRLSDGRRHRLAGVPAVKDMSSVGWDTEDSFVFPVYGPSQTTSRGAEGARRALLIRCDTENLTCERATPELLVPVSTALLAR